MFIFIIGLIIGILINFNISYFSLAEIIIIFHLVILTLKNKKIVFEKKTKNFWIFSVIFILITTFYLISTKYNSSLVIKNIFKYLDITILTYYFYTLYRTNKNNCINYTIGIALGNILIIFKNTIQNGISYSLHYSPFIILTILLLIKFHNNKRIYYMVYIMSFILGLIGHSRTTILIIALSILYDLFTKSIGKVKNKKQLAKKIISGILLVTLVIIGSDLASKNLNEKTQSNNERKYLIETAFKEIKDNPLFGVGPGGFNMYAQSKYGLIFSSNDLSTHNQFLEIACEWGLIGFAIYIIPYIILLLNIMNYKENKTNKKMYVALFCFMLFDVVSGDFRTMLAIMQSFCLYDLSLTNEKRKKVNE